MKNFPPHFIPFNTSIEGIELPEKFTFPFVYEPHTLAEIASKQVQEYLRTQTDFEHNFGLNLSQKGAVIGKMFGVLVVQNENGELGFLAAFSGKLGNSNEHTYFVPPVFDTLKEEAFLSKGMTVLNEFTLELKKLKSAALYQVKTKALAEQTLLQHFEIEALHVFSKKAKDRRQTIRLQFRDQTTNEALTLLEKRLNDESIHFNYSMKKLKEFWKTKLQLLRDEIEPFEQKIQALTNQRAEKSAQLQQQLFESYFFLNKEGLQKNLGEIFNDTAEKKPPAGAGECAAPKLLQYAFANNLKPITMAEFWWGKSPQSEIRQHTNYYGACKSKCEPILSHMLQGIEMDSNPLLVNPAIGKEIPIIYEDDALIVVNKPAEFLSVPGKTISDSIYTRIKKIRPDATGPIIVHRLDMSTSGILILTKTEEAYRHLQQQFIKRSVKKRYAALLDGNIIENDGQIELPLRVDLNDRPRQMVCFEHGKKAVTYWKKIKTIQEKTLVHFFPVTGRTHQLRVHAAHENGLNTPILGDDLYGKKEQRLYLHAEWISFIHPSTNKKIQFEIKNDFETLL